MMGFELKIADARGNRSTSCAATEAHFETKDSFHFKLGPSRGPVEAKMLLEHKVKQNVCPQS